MENFVQNLLNAVSLSSLYALFALGIALIFGVMRLINFAHGELITIGAFAIIVIGGAPLPVVSIVTLVTVVVFALAMERVAFRPVRGADPTTLLITSFAISFFLQNLAVMIFGTLPRSINIGAFFTGFETIGSIRVSRLTIATLIVGLVVFGCLTAFLFRTRLGVQMRAAAEDFTMARLLGVRANLIIASAFALSGLLAAIGSILLVAQTGTVWAGLGLHPVIVAFMAVVLGGVGSLGGAVLGAFVLGTITVMLQAYLPVEVSVYRDALAFSAVFALLLARPGGLIVPRSLQTRV